jgi:hypothetical protein
MEAVCLAVDYIIEDIDSGSSQRKAEKTTNGTAHSREHLINWSNEFFSEYQGCKYKYILSPVQGTHDLQEFHILAFH